MKKTLLLVFSLLLSLTSFAQGTIDFDDDNNWTMDGSGYSNNHTYSEGVISVAGGEAYRQGTAAQGGYPGAFGKYSWRLRNNDAVEWTITVASGGVEDFGLKIRRWDGSPSPDFDLSYSINGTDWVNVATINNASLDDVSEWKTFTGEINSTADNIKIRLKANGSTERIMVDDFFWTVEGSEPATLELTTPNGGESYNGGETVQLAWNSTNVANVYFEVWNNDSEWSRLTQDIASVDGANTYDYMIPENAWTWDGYKIRVVDATLATTNDESDATFEINGHDTNLFWEDFSGSQFNTTTAHNVAGAKTWRASSDYAEMNGYASSGQEDEEDWLVTNAIVLDNTTDELFTFQSSLSYPKPGSDLTVLYSSDYSGSGDPSTANWNALSPTMATSSSYTHSGYVDLSSISGTIYIAFKYVGTTTEADKWQIKEIQVTGVEDTSTDVDAPKVAKMEVGPNPFVNEFEIKTPKTVVDVVMYNTAGQVVKNDRSGSKLVNTANLSNGMYVLQVKFADGTTITQKVIKK